MRSIRTVALLAALAAPALAQETVVEFKGPWVNSKELSLDKLRSKVVVLYFYEET